MQPIKKDSIEAASLIAGAKKTLECEIQGLKQMADSLNDSYTNAVKEIFTLQDGKNTGRLILSGIGKSGHIANKIAATMASTGTPAFYVHPNEASHGDLGMITDNDAVLLLSNSGENSELSDIIAYTRRFGITLIALTSNPDSTLAKHADIPLIIPKAKEACGIGMAPTTSTTMMLAMGDALAVSLLNLRGLTKEDFSVFHPGGKLGQKLKHVSDLMLGKEELALLKDNIPMDQAIITMVEKNIGSAIIIDDKEKVLGIITDGDIKRIMGPELASMTTGDVMSKNPKSIRPDILAAEGLDIMLNKFGSPITSLLVTDEQERIVGLLRVQECLKAGIV